MVASMGKRFDGVRAALAEMGRAVIEVLVASAKARRSALALFAVLAYLLIGRGSDPGFTHYWWYQLFQTSATLVVVLTLETIFAAQGGIAWQTHVIVVITTYADVIGTAEHLYDAFGPYDKIVHFWSGAAFAAGMYEVLRLLDCRGTLVITPRQRVLVAVWVSFAIAGVAWELYEHLSDTLFHSGRVQSRWDTTHDLVSDACGAVAAVAVLRVRELARGQVGRRQTI
jgi:uncharacterized membrane protein YjdF